MLKLGCKAALLGLVAASLSTLSGITAQQPTFRADVDVVQLDVSVLDHARRPVQGLTAADFTVLDNGVVQPIMTFVSVALPDREVDDGGWVRAFAPDVTNNRVDAQRVVILLMDDFYMPREPDVLKLARETAFATIDNLGPADMAAVVYMVARRNGQELTRDRLRLRAAIDRFTPSGFNDRVFEPSNSASSALSPSGSYGSYPRIPERRSGACIFASCMAMALKNIGDVLAGWPGARKTVIFVSPGPSGGIVGLDDVAGTEELRQAFRSMQQANVNIYAFDPRGLRTEVPVQERVAWGDFRTFVESTGGRALTDTNAPSTYVSQVFRENSSYYLLGFVPTNPGTDGRFRRLTVTVNRPGVEVRTRSGYYAPQPARATKTAVRVPPGDLDRAIAGGLPGGNLPLRIAAAPLPVSGARTAALAVLAGLEADADWTTPATVDLVATAFTDTWSSAGAVTQQVEIGRRAGDGGAHVDIASRLDLKPGRYEIRVAATHPATGRTGVAHASVTIPDFARESVTLSGAVLVRPSTAARTGPRQLAGLLEEGATTARTFAAGDQVTAVVRVHQGGNKPLVPVELRSRIVDTRDRIVHEDTRALTPAEFNATRTFEYRLPLPLARLEAGEFLLTMEIAAGKTSSRRDVRFSRQ